MEDIESNPAQDQPIQNIYELVPKGESQTLSRRSIVLEWNDVNYSVPVPGKTGEMKQILFSLGGAAYPGEILGILGTSGAGKSTLLDVLAGRLDSKFQTGTLTTNGVKIHKRQFRRESGYVMQSDALFPFLTVRETFRYAAYFRVHEKTREEKDEIADNTIKLLRLERAADTIVGDEKVRGISGGEKRRVSIGVDIVHQPKVIFLDEPTSGLDSTTALSIVDALKQIAVTQQSTIVMTIHQPSAKLFNIIDKAMFLSAGKVTYYGPSTALLAYVSQIYNEAGYGSPPVANPPELFLELCDQLHSEQKLDLLTSKYGKDGENAAALTSSTSLGTLEEDSTFHYANSVIGDIIILSSRSMLNIIRTKELFFARLGSAVFFAVQIGTLFLHTDDSDTGLRHRTAYFVFILAFFYWTSLEALPIFLQEREIFQREYSSGAYRAIAYTASQLLVYLPFMIAIAVVFTCISWWLVGLPNDAGVVFFQFFAVFIVLVAGNTFTTMISTLLPDPMAAQTIGSALFSVMFLYSGFFITRSEIPKYWIYLHYMSLFKYGYDSMLVNAFQHQVYNDDATNEQILGRFSVDHTNRWTGVGVLIAWILLYRAIFYYRLVTAFNGSRKE